MLTNGVSNCVCLLRYARLRKSFRNPARAELAGESDSSGLTLHHWTKAHIEPPAYVFARFNVKCDVTRYSDEEYENALALHQDPQMKWTKEETDILMGLCSRFDLRCCNTFCEAMRGCGVWGMLTRAAYDICDVGGLSSPTSTIRARLPKERSGLSKISSTATTKRHGCWGSTAIE